MLAIYKREVKAFFQSVIGWLFLAATLGLFGLYFYVYNLAYGSPYIGNTLSATTVIMLITIPVLTMRILAEEQKAKTDQLILTAPVTVGKVVIGKYLAVGSIFSMAVAVMAATPLFLQMFGDVPLKECYAAILGYWLFGMTCIAIGTFISSITESQVIAAVLSFVVLFIGFMMEGITSVISSGGNLLTKVLNGFNLTAGMDKFFSGTIEIPSLIYYLSLICLFLFFTTQAIQKRRWSMSTQKLRLGMFSSGMIAVSLAAAVAVNMASSQLPENIRSIDMTAQKLYSITEDTKKMLEKVKEDITIYVLANEKNQDTTLQKTLERYASASKHIKIEYKDPAVSPTFYTNYSDTALSQNSLVVEGEKRAKVIDYSSIYQSETDYQTYQQTVTGYDGEGQITSAISYVTSETTGGMYAVTGHEEVPLSGTFLDALEKQNITLTSLNLLEETSIPEDAECIFLLAPAKDYSQDDTKKILDYLDKGGKAVIATNYADTDMPNFNEILQAFQITVDSGVIVETDTDHYYQNPYYLLPQIESDTVTADTMDGYIFAPFAQGLTFPQQTEDEAGAEGITYTPLLTVGDGAFSKRDVTTADDYSKGEQDISGPFTIGLHAVREAATENADSAELYVFGSGSLFTDSASQMVYGNNLKLFTAVTGQFTEGQAKSVIPVKSYEMSALALNQTSIIVGGLLVAISLPILLLVIGIVIWARRRKR